MGCSLSAELSHYRGHLKNGDYVIIASNNLIFETNYNYTKNPFYVNQIGQTYMENIKSNSVINSKLYMNMYNSKNLSGNDMTQDILIFQILFQDNNSFHLKVVGLDYQMNMLNHESNIYLNVNLNGEAILSHKPLLLNISDIPNISSPNSLQKNIILTDVGYILQDYNGSNVLWNYNIRNNSNINNKEITFEQIRFIPLQGFININGEIYNYNENVLELKSVQKTIYNDFKWCKNIFQQRKRKYNGKYDRIYLDRNECIKDSWYEYPNILTSYSINRDDEYEKGFHKINKYFKNTLHDIIDVETQSQSSYYIIIIIIILLILISCLCYSFSKTFSK